MTSREPAIHVIGLGPAGEDLVTTGTAAAIEAHPQRYLRTSRHPAASLLGDAPSFDHLYESLDTFDEVYAAIVDALVAAAIEHGDVLYAVPGSPSVAERTVELLLADDRVAVDITPALSFADLTWSRLGVDPLADGATIIDGHRFAELLPRIAGPVLVAQCDQPWVLSDMKLAIDDPDGELTATIVQRLGLPDEHIETVAWNDLDRTVAPDHLTSVWIAEAPTTVASMYAQFEDMVRLLRVECPWDAKQTHESLRRYLLEETYETIEAIDKVVAGDDDGYEHLAEELGDLLYQIFFHSVIASEDGGFTSADVARGIHDKLHVRHPHVYGDVDVAGADEVVSNWEAIKKAEKGRDSVMDGIPDALPSLLYALKVQKKAASQDFGLPDLQAALADVDDELAELRSDPSVDEAGDLLFAAVQVVRQLDADPEMALRDASRRFRDRFQYLEAAADVEAVTVAELGDDRRRELWRDAKAIE